MIPLHIPAIAKLIEDADSAAEIYRRLNGHWYLSFTGRFSCEEVIALIQQTIDDYPKHVVCGSELSRSIISDLDRAGYISILGRTWGMIGRKR